jgi:hypothetical protein
MHDGSTADGSDDRSSATGSTGSGGTPGDEGVAGEEHREASASSEAASIDATSLDGDAGSKADVSDARTLPEAGDAAPADVLAVVDAALDATQDAAAATCTNGPYVQQTVVVHDVSTPTVPLAGVTVKASACNASDTSNAAGTAKLDIPLGMESWLRLEMAGKIPTMLPARTLFSDTSEDRYIFNDQYRQGYFPDYDAAKAEILINVARIGGATAPCDTSDGVSITVPGHAEAVVTYWMGGFPNMKATGATATTVTGTATITGIAAGTQVFIVAQKASCKVIYDYTSSASPKIPLETAAVTYVVPILTN